MSRGGCPVSHCVLMGAAGVSIALSARGPTVLSSQRTAEPHAGDVQPLPFFGIKLPVQFPHRKTQMFNFRLADVSLLAEM